MAVVNDPAKYMYRSQQAQRENRKKICEGGMYPSGSFHTGRAASPFGQWRKDLVQMKPSAVTKTLQRLFGSRRSPDDDTIGTLVRREFTRIRAEDAETHLRWAALSRGMEAPSVRRRPRSLVPRLALGGVALAVVAGVYFFNGRAPTRPEEFATEIGERKQLVLPDSSEVTLNYRTALTVPPIVAGETRRVSLAGEAFFRVRHNDTPFIVSTGVADVRVVGTAFNVRSREGMLEVAVLEGIVVVTASRAAGDSTLVLTRNQKAICTGNAFPVRTADISPANYPGWLRGKLFLDKTPLETACREIELRFNVAITMNDRSLRDEPVSGTLEAPTAQAAIASLCKLTGREFTERGTTYTIF